MSRPEQQLINEAGTVVERYIAKLEQNLAVAEQQLSVTRKLLGIGEACSVSENVQILISKYLELKAGKRNITEQDYAEQCSAEQTIKQREQLDQFAMASITLAHEQVQKLPQITLKRIVGKENSEYPISGEDVRQAVAVTAYLMAEAMQAESQKRQGGEV